MKIVQRTKQENFNKDNLSGLFLLVGEKDASGDYKILADSFNPYNLEKFCKRSFGRLMKERQVIFC